MMAGIILKSICILTSITHLSARSVEDKHHRERFLVTNVEDNNPLKYYPEAIRDILPASSETNTSFRYNLTGLTSSDRAVLYNLSSSHVVCAGCYGVSSDFQAHRCNNGIIVCKAGSACISGSIIDYSKAYHQDAITDTADSYPYKGCCDPTSRQCQLTVKVVQTCASRVGCNHRAYYQLATCTGYMCNAPESFFRTLAPDISTTRTSKVNSVTLTPPQDTTPSTHAPASSFKTLLPDVRNTSITVTDGVTIAPPPQTMPVTHGNGTVDHSLHGPHAVTANNDTKIT